MPGSLQIPVQKRINRSSIGTNYETFPAGAGNIYCGFALHSRLITVQCNNQYFVANSLWRG
jgi:hypothetical protein